MVIGIGCDLVSHDFTKQLGWEDDPNVLERVFTEMEIHEYESRKNIAFLAGRFAVKEAVLKCIKTGMEDGISLLDIEVTNHENGYAEISIYGKVREVAEDLGIENWQVTISHAEKTSLAFVLAQSSGFNSI